jgi:cAMP-dependent protein kinase regulator
VRINLDEIQEISNSDYLGDNLVEDSSIDTEKKDVKYRRNSIFTRTYNPDENEDDEDCDNESDKLNEDSKAKSHEIRKKLEEILRSIVMFKHLCEEDFNQILDNMFEKRCCANEVIIKEGDDGNYFYVIDQGIYEIYKNEDYVKKIGEYKNSGYFGELALLYNQPRLATIISVESNGVLWVMTRDMFKRLVISNAFKRRKVYEEFLKSVPLLKECLNDYERMQVADSLTSVIFKRNDCIIKAGDLANGMYFIEDGQVKIVLDSKKKEIDEIILNKGHYFGEIALINKIHRSASVYCLTETCKLAFLEIEVFERLMGPCIDVFKQNIKNYHFAKDDE